MCGSWTWSGLRFLVNDTLMATLPALEDRLPWWRRVSCPECKGTGEVPLFTSLSPCRRCDGKGGWAQTDPQVLAEMLETEEGREAYVAEQRRMIELREHEAEARRKAARKT